MVILTRLICSIPHENPKIKKSNVLCTRKYKTVRKELTLARFSYYKYQISEILFHYMQKIKFSSLFVLAGLTLALGQNEAQAQTLADGIRQTEAENYKAARKTFRALMNKDPKDAKPYYYMGDLLLQTSTLDSANAMFRKGMEVRSKEPLNYVGLAKVQFKQNKPVEADANIEEALKLSRRKDPAVMLEAAEAYMSAKHLDKAINMLTEAIKLDNKNADLYLLRGEAYFQKNVGGPAVTDFEQAARLNPKLAQAHMKIGKIFSQSRNYTQALDALQKAVAIDTTFAPAYRELGELYYQASQLENARDAYKTYVRLANNDIDARGRYAGFLYLSKDYPTAIAYADEVLAQDPKNYIMLRVKAYSLHESGDAENALKTMDQYFATAPKDKMLASDYENYGNILLKLDQNEKALENLNKALAMDTANVDIHVSLANLYQKNKEYNKAAHHFQKRINKGEGITLQDYFALGQAHYLGKNYQSADSAFAKITEVQPDLVVGHQWRARAMSSLDPETTKGLAKEHYEKVVEKGTADPAKNKAALIEAHEYLGYFYALKNDKTQARSHYQKIKELDPKNAKATEALKGL